MGQFGHLMHQTARVVAPARMRHDEVYEIDETYWGYIIRSAEPPWMGLVIAQAVAGFLGVACAMAGLGLWVVPISHYSPELLPMRLGLFGFVMSLAALFLWFASRGLRSELQVDTRICELREVVRNRSGTPTLIGRYAFDTIGGVFIEREADRSLPDRLVMRYGNTVRRIPVAAGPSAALTPLRDRLGRDLLARRRAAPHRPARPVAQPTPQTAAEPARPAAADGLQGPEPA